MSLFSATVTSDERVIVRREGRTIRTLAGAEGRRVAARLATAGDDEARQMILAKATGNYRRGNER